MVLVTVDAAANTITITPCDDAGTPTAPQDVINGGTISTITWGLKRFQPAPYVADQNQFGGPATPGQPNFYPTLQHYQVFIKQNGLPKIYTIDLTLVQNQGTWTNDEAGVAVAIGALDAAIP